MEKGWIKLSRSLPEHWLYEEDRFDHAHAWIDLLMLANFSDRKTVYKGELIVCKRGDVNYSLKYLAERWGWSWKAVKHFIEVLESDGMVSTNITTNRTVISIINYEKYQQGINEGHNEDTNEGINEGINEGHINNKRKERKESKESKNKYGEYQHVMLTEKEKDQLFNDYGETETLEAIKYLDEYIEMKGYKAKSHYLCIRKWVFDAVKRQNDSNKAYKGTSVFDAWANA